MEHFIEEQVSMTDSDVEICEMKVEIPYQNPPPITRKTCWKKLKEGDGRHDIKAICKRAGVNLSGITRCSFTKI